MQINNAYDAFWFLHDHPNSVDGKDTYSLLHDHAFIDNLDIMYVKVNPTINAVSESEHLNTWTQVWLETGPQEWDSRSKEYISTHDPRLDCGGDTFDLALISLANLVKKYYGDYEK